MLARAFALALEREGYSVRTANSAEHGLRLLRSEQPAAIILDLKMPFINGAVVLPASQQRVLRDPGDGGHGWRGQRRDTSRAGRPAGGRQIQAAGVNELLTAVRTLLSQAA